MRKSTFGYYRLFYSAVLPHSHASGICKSLGCVLFALAYLHSPFENLQTTEQGGSIAMAVLNAQYKHPTSSYSQGLKTLIDSMIKANPQDRPDIQQVPLFPCPTYDFVYSRHSSGSCCNGGPATLRMRHSTRADDLYPLSFFHGLSRSVIME